MPGEDGISIARRLRAMGKTPIIMLTGLDDVVDRVVGLEIGADDYMTKPFDLRELKARVKAVLRRTDSATTSAAPGAAMGEEGNRVCFGKVCLDLERNVLIGEDGAEIHLTATEFNLLAVFARNPNRVLSREQLLETAPGRDGEPFDRSIDIRVARIRKKVEAVPDKPQVIRTVRSVGYIYVPPRAAA
jgi:two-component system phosphate regulon response regulator OmpR